MSKNEIHERFIAEPFYVNNNSVNETTKITNKPFYYESCLIISESELSIPENSDDIIKQMFSEWKEEHEELIEYFRERNRKLAYEPMVRGLANLISITTWLNNGLLNNLTNLMEELDQLALKPINLHERLGFVLKQPDHYHSFIQLSGLYTELEKLYYKQKITSLK